MHLSDKWWTLAEINGYLNLDVTPQRMRQVSSRLQQHNILVKPERTMTERKLDLGRSFSTLNQHVFDAYFYLVRSGQINTNSRGWHKQSPMRQLLIEVQQVGWWWASSTETMHGILPPRKEVTLIHGSEQEGLEREGR